MSRKDETPRAVGPYPDRAKWRVVYKGIARCKSGREAELFDNKKAAEDAIEVFNLVAQKKIKVTLGKGIKLYLKTCEARGLKQTTRETTMHRLNAFFPKDTQGRTLRAITPKYAQACYDAIVKDQEADTHKNTLQEVKRFFKWAAEERYAEASPVASIKEQGKRKHRKAQLRLTEARRFVSLVTELLSVLELPDPITALSLYGIRPPGWYHGPAQLPAYRQRMRAGLIAALTALLLGVRCSEIVQRKVRDLDDEGRLFVIEETDDQDVKTESSERVLEVPELLRPHLLSLALGKNPEEKLFGERDRRWVLHWSKRLCALAGVKVVTAHGLRGSFASIASSQGAATHLVSAALGHGGVGISKGSYIEPGAEQSGKARQIGALIVPQPFREEKTDGEK